MDHSQPMPDGTGSIEVLADSTAKEWTFTEERSKDLDVVQSTGNEQLCESTVELEKPQNISQENFVSSDLNSIDYNSDNSDPKTTECIDSSVSNKTGDQHTMVQENHPFVNNYCEASSKDVTEDSVDKDQLSEVHSTCEKVLSPVNMEQDEVNENDFNNSEEVPEKSPGQKSVTESNDSTDMRLPSQEIVEQMETEDIVECDEGSVKDKHTDASTDAEVTESRECNEKILENSVLDDVTSDSFHANNKTSISESLENSKTNDADSTSSIQLTQENGRKDQGDELTNNEPTLNCDSEEKQDKITIRRESQKSVSSPVNSIDESSRNSTEKSVDHSKENADENMCSKTTEDKDTENTSNEGTVTDSAPVNEDDRSMEENPVFVQVNSKTEKSSSSVDVEPADENMEVEAVIEEDPIGVFQEPVEKDDTMEYEDGNTDKPPMKVVDKTVISDLVSGKGADEELCIIPDTDREISQAEKDAATAAASGIDSPGTLPVTEKTTEVSLDPNSDSVRNTIVANEINSNSDTSKEQGSISIVNHVNQASPAADEFRIHSIPDNERNTRMCNQCTLPRKCPFRVCFEGRDIYFCADTCAVTFKNLTKQKKTAPPAPTPATRKSTRASLKLKDMSRDVPVAPAPVHPPENNRIFERRCAECGACIPSQDERVLSWETMEFCYEECLAKYQTKIGSHCASCHKNVALSSLGKYCVRFGHDIRQFCCSGCLEEFKKGLKVCSYCQKDISGGPEGFLAPVGDKGQFKDFCSQSCMENFDIMSNKNSNRVPVVEVGVCSVCTNEKPLPITFEKSNNKHRFCSEPCFVAFKFVNHVEPIICDMCKKYFEKENNHEFAIHTDNGLKNFCCKTCQNIHIIANRRIVPCSWCKVKKYNFDMIKRICATGQVLNMCSLNCLSLFQVSVTAVNAKKVQQATVQCASIQSSTRLKCDFCQKTIQAQYHLTMSDATLRNFCSYQCVLSFQNQFPTAPITYGQDNRPQMPPTPTGPPRRTYHNTRSSMRSAQPPPGPVPVSTEPDLPLPVITNVQSLATPNEPVQPVEMPVRTSVSSCQTPQLPLQPVVKQQVIVKAFPRPQMRNKNTQVKPITKTKAINCKVQVCNKETQTDEIKEKVRLVPVPVPIYIPAPMHMFSRPMPVPVPFPMPIPVPVFVPTTRNSAAGIMKEIKKIQAKIPTDPFEAELLMMAEMVAGEKKIDHTDSESDDEDNGGTAADTTFSPEAVDTSNTFGDDMLQMALKMATELDEPAVDLEGALAASTITATQTAENTAASEENVDDPQALHAHHTVLDRGQALRGRKRTVRQVRGGGALMPAKRGRRISSNVDMPMLPPPQPAQPPEPVEKPDANMCLKYTFGVNAWKQWVTTKNAELEKSSRRMKLFKNEILQLTADELNYSLCLFVKEVRKPNGTEYAPDTIYYLCLGIQQYLFENGRIDNIFTDAYYEKFTDCLDEVAKKFSVLYNDSHYIVTRVEEEHLWESKQLGAHSPHVLLSTLMFFNTKHFNLTTVDEHMQLSFSHIMKHWKRNPNQPGAAKVPGSRNVLLRFYPPQSSLDNNSRKKKVYEQQENEENPLRCPVKLYEFYLSKCPESVKTRNDVFYLLPERSCVPDSPVWYSTMALGKEALEKMLHRVKMVKEINVALLTS